MSVDISLLAANVRLDAITAAVGNAGILRLYSGTRPANVAAAITGTVLAELVCGSPFAPVASGGQLAATAMASDASANASGTASHFRLFKADGVTAVLDGDVGLHGSTADLTLSNVAIVSGEVVSITAWRISASGYRWWDSATIWDFDPMNRRAMAGDAPMLPSVAVATTRATVRSIFDAAGYVQDFGTDKLGLAAGIGVSVGSAFVNKIRNPRGEGGTVGVIGSGGALPTNWGQLSGAGLSWSLIGTGTEDGLPFTDVRWFGTATGAAQIGFETITNALCVVGNAFGMDAHVKLIAGTSPSVTPYAKLYTSASAYITDRSFAASVIPSGTRVQVLGKQVVPDATVGYIRPYLLITTLNATVYDFTLRIYAPKLVQVPVVTSAEMVVNGDPSSGNTTGWAVAGGGGASIANVGSKLRVSCGTNAFTAATQTMALTLNAVYKTVMTLFANPNARAVRGGFCRAGGANFTSILSSSAAGPVTVTGYYVFTDATSNVLSLGYTNGISLDTLDWGLVSVMQVFPGYMPAFPILPPVGTPGDSTKAVDDVVAVASGGDPFAGFTAVGLNAACTEYVIPNWTHIGDGVNRPLFEYVKDATNYIRASVNSSGYPTLRIMTGGVMQADISLTTQITAAREPLAFGWSSAGAYIVDKGGHSANSGVITVPTGLTSKRIGSSQTGNYVNDALQRVSALIYRSPTVAAAWAAAA